MKTTLNQIRAHDPCKAGWKKLLAYLGKTAADDEPLLIVTILDSNGLNDALWCLRAVSGHDREIRLYAVWCARQVQHLMTDPRSCLAVLDVAERFANGLATAAELAEAQKDAREMAGDEAWAASATAAAWAATAAAAEAGAGAAASAAEAAARAVVVGVGAAASVETAAWAARASAWEATREAQRTRLRELCAETEKDIL